MADSTVVAMQPSMVVRRADVFSTCAANGYGAAKSPSGNHVHASLNPYRACEDGAAKSPSGNHVHAVHASLNPYRSCEGQWASGLQDLSPYVDASEQRSCQTRTTGAEQEPINGVKHLNIFANGFVTSLISDTVSNFVDDCICVEDYDNDDDFEFDTVQAAPASVEEGSQRDAQLRDDVPIMQQARTIMKVASSSTLTGGEDEDDDEDMFSVSSEEEEQQIGMVDSEPYAQSAMNFVNWAVRKSFKEEATETNQVSELDSENVEFTFSVWAAELEEQVLKASVIKAAQAAWVSNYIGSLLNEGVSTIAKEQVHAEQQQEKVKSHQEGIIHIGQQQLDSAARIESVESILQTKPVTTEGDTAPSRCTTKASKKELKRRKSGLTLESSPPPTMATSIPNSRSRRRIIGGVGRTPADPNRQSSAARPEDQHYDTFGTEFDFVNAQDKWMGVNSRLGSDHTRATSNGGTAISRAPFRSGISALAMDLGEDAPVRSMWQVENRASSQHHSTTPRDMRKSSSLGTLKVSKSHNNIELSPVFQPKQSFLPGLSNNITSSGSIAWSVHMARSATWRNNVAGVF